MGDCKPFVCACFQHFSDFSWMAAKFKAFFHVAGFPAIVDVPTAALWNDPCCLCCCLLSHCCAYDLIPLLLLRSYPAVALMILSHCCAYDLIPLLLLRSYPAVALMILSRCCSYDLIPLLLLWSYPAVACYPAVDGVTSLAGAKLMLFRRSCCYWRLCSWCSSTAVLATCSKIKPWKAWANSLYSAKLSNIYRYSTFTIVHFPVDLL
jgi:hypothetical protein